MGFDFVDLDTSVNALLRLTDSSTGSFVTLGFDLFEDGSGSIHEVAGASFGDRHANRILDIRASEVGLAQFDVVAFELQSSGGIGTVYVETVPEPGTAALLLLASIAWLGRRPVRGLAER